MELKFPQIATSALLPIAGFAITFVSAFALNWLALIPWRRSVGKHWSERARLLFPAQASARSWAWLLPIFFGCLSYMITGTFLPVALSGFLGASMAPCRSEPGFRFAPHGFFRPAPPMHSRCLQPVRWFLPMRCLQPFRRNRSRRSVPMNWCISTIGVRSCSSG